MKLFKSLLVAPATLGLLAPISAVANEITINDFNPVNENILLAGGEGLVDSHDGGFSETTTASFSADMAIGAVDGIAGNEALTAGYSFQIDLSTSFTGEDSLDISIDAGNADDGNLAELDLNDSGDTLAVDGVSYTFPLGDKTTVFVGDNMDGSTLFSTACVYGGPTIQLDDCGNSGAAFAAGKGTAAGASYDFGNGFTAAIGYEGEGASTNGLFTKEGMDVFGGQVTYTGDSYGASVTYSDYESATDTTYLALNAYYTFDGGLSVSAGYEAGTLGSVAAAQDETIAYFFGIETELGAGTFGAAIGTAGAMTEASGTITEAMMYEAYYSYPVNDGMTLTPGVFIKEGTTDETGVAVKASFSF